MPAFQSICLAVPSDRRRSDLLLLGGSHRLRHLTLGRKLLLLLGVTWHLLLGITLRLLLGVTLHGLLLLLSVCGVRVHHLLLLLLRVRAIWLHLHLHLRSGLLLIVALHGDGVACRGWGHAWRDNLLLLDSCAILLGTLVFVIRVTLFFLLLVEEATFVAGKDGDHDEENEEPLPNARSTMGVHRVIVVFKLESLLAQFRVIACSSHVD